MALGAKGAARVEKRGTSGVGRDISPLRLTGGHISLDLAKQSEHLNFKYCHGTARRLLPSDDLRQTVAN